MLVVVVKKLRKWQKMVICGEMMAEMVRKFDKIRQNTTENENLSPVGDR